MYTLPKRSLKSDREKQLVTASLEIIKTEGLDSLTRMNVATLAGIAPSSVNAIFGSMDKLREAVVQFAIDELYDDIGDNTMLQIVVDGLLRGYAVAKYAPPHIREAAARSVM